VPERRKGVHDGQFHSSREYGINPFIWCAVGALIGGVTALTMPGQGSVMLIENILVAVFGAFIGGDFLVSMLNGGVVNDKVFHMSSLGMAIAGAVVMLVALRLMRGAVGPMRATKSKAGQRRP
jgi:uncharacterized membrane protein YeaQ/YmgE (transglycosylase-associated protein family)